MAYILDEPRLVLTKTLDSKMNIGLTLNEFLKNADMSCPYMGLRVGMRDLQCIRDDKGNWWSISKLIVGAVVVDPCNASLTFSQLKSGDASERELLKQYLKNNLASVALNVGANRTVYIELDNCFEIRGIPQKMRFYTKYGKTASFAIIGLTATLPFGSGACQVDFLEQMSAQEQEKCSSILNFERSREDADPRLTKQMLKWLMSNTRDHDLCGMQKERDVWHEYLRGQEIVHRAIKRLEEVTRDI